MKLTLKSVRPEAGNVKTFVFSPESEISWKAGQYMHYVLPHEPADERGNERWFTISSAPHEKDVQITTRIFDGDGSSFKKALNAMSVGDQIEADGPEGSFVVDDPNQEHVFIAGGIGITPMRSIIAELAHHNLPIYISLLYANRDENVVFKDELEAIADKHHNFNIEYFIGDNLIDKDALAKYLSGSAVFYVSGPKPMVEAVNQQLLGLGLDSERIKLDDFPGYETI